jgi:hypothetical protein
MGGGGDRERGGGGEGGTGGTRGTGGQGGQGEDTSVRGFPSHCVAVSPLGGVGLGPVEVANPKGGSLR